MFVHDEVEFVLGGFGFPAAGAGAVVLEFDDVFLQDEAGFEESVHDAAGQGDEVAAAARVAHEDGAEAAGLEHAVEFGGCGLHRVAEFFDAADGGQVAFDTIGVADDIEVGRMGED